VNHTLHLRWGAALLIALAASAVAAPKDKKEKDKGKVDVSLTAPAAHASYTAPAAIVMAAHAISDQRNHPVVKVEFFQGSTLLGTASSAPYSFTWTNAGAGNYRISATATNDKGDTATADPIDINVNAPPTVDLAAPANHASYIAPAHIVLTANAADSDGSIAKVEFFSGATLLATVTQPPYHFAWTDAPPAHHSLTAKATDNQGASTLSRVVAITVVPNQLPTVSLSTPTRDQKFVAPAGILLNATASDADGSIAKVEFYQGSTLIGTVTDTPFMSYWTNVPIGSYSLRAKATDNLGGTTTSEAIQIAVVANTPPSITVSATPSTATAPASVHLTASATDTDGSIAKVEFFNGATLLATVTQAPYGYDWPNVPEGSYTIMGRATDNSGAVTSSASVMVSVTTGQLRPYFIETDHLNTPRRITDQSNNVVWQWQNNDPFGNNVPSSSAGFEFNLRFPGQYFDRETNLHYNYYRDYDPSTGRYVQSDPIGLEGGINTFAYALNNPISWVDRLGLDVYLCSQPALGFLPVDHQWLKTDTVEAGMGGTRGNEAGNQSGDWPGDPVKVADHSGRSKQEGASCEKVEGVDEKAVNDLLKLDRPLGRWGPTNQCQSFVNDVLSKGRRSSSGAVK